MAGHIRKIKRKTGITYQARMPDPTRGGTAKVERSFRTKREAEAWLAMQQTSVLSGTWADPRKRVATFDEVVDAWRATWPGRLEPKTTYGYESHLRRHLLPQFGGRRVTAITSKSVQDYIARLTARGLSGTTVRGIYAALRAAMNAGQRAGLLAENPCRHIQLPRANSGDKIVLTADEVTALAEAITPRYRVLIYLTAYTGLRASEVHALRRGDVDLDRGRLHVRRSVKEIHGELFWGDTKNHLARSVALPAFLLAMIRDHLALPSPGGTHPDASLFPGARGAVTRHHNFFNRDFRPAVRRVLPHKSKLRFHDLRHTCAALMIAQGAHPKAIQQRLGHSSIQVTLDVYGHLLPSLDDALTDALDSLFRSTRPAATAETHTESAVGGPLAGVSPSDRRIAASPT